jgi:hypothetical protein
MAARVLLAIGRAPNGNQKQNPSKPAEGFWCPLVRRIADRQAFALPLLHGPAAKHFLPHQLDTRTICSEKLQKGAE